MSWGQVEIQFVNLLTQGAPLIVQLSCILRERWRMMTTSPASALVTFFFFFCVDEDRLWELGDSLVIFSL